MRISDWSSDVCSSDLDVSQNIKDLARGSGPKGSGSLQRSYSADASVEYWVSTSCYSLDFTSASASTPASAKSIGSFGLQSLAIGIILRSFERLAQSRGCRQRRRPQQIGRASCRERGWQYVKISVVAVSLKKQKNK